MRLVGSTTSVLHGTGPHNAHVAPDGDLAPVTGMPCQNLNCEPTPGALSFHTSIGLTVQDCSFEHLGSAALYLGDGAQHSHIVGNEFAQTSLPEPWLSVVWTAGTWPIRHNRKRTT